MRNTAPKITVVNIQSFSKKGHGIGVSVDPPHAHVEVPFTIPGDTASAALHRKKSGLYSASLLQLLTPAAQRIQPRCVHFGVCGGCRWQQMAYEEQLRLKQATVEALFRPLIDAQLPIGAILPAPAPWEYRNKMEFSFSNDASGKQYLGLIIDGSRGKVLNLAECHLVRPWFIQAARAVRCWWAESGLQAYHPHYNRGALRTLVLREGIRSGDRLLMLTVSGNPDDKLSRQQIDSFTAFVRDALELQTEGSLSIFLRIQQAIKGQETQFFEMLLYGPDQIRETLHIELQPGAKPLSLAFSISPSAFFQPNTMQAERLYSTALQLLQTPKEILQGAVVYDLYCGTGTLGICAARLAKQVVGIEISPEATLDARTNVKNNHLDNVQILTAPVKEAMRSIRIEKTLPAPDIVMLDPPRVGLDEETVQHLLELQPRHLLYISCNPATQAENVKALLKGGYLIEAIQPVDQFPHTVHIENIVVLRRP
jgi:23S rRNA (uracil1939-C5)-methyltransferase